MIRRLRSVLALALLVGCSPPFGGAKELELADEGPLATPSEDDKVLEAGKDPPKESPPTNVGGHLPLQVGEPAFCEPAAFGQKEVTLTTPGIANLHAFKLGSVMLAGLGVGDSDVASVEALAKAQAPSLTAAEKSCTFYYNDGNDAAKTAFNWYYVSKPSGSSYASKVTEYSKVLGNVFDASPTSFLSCASAHKYVAMGCDGMHHRGPSVFAAVLAYSGCSPEHATAIVNAVWGENGIEPQMRIEIAKWAADLGAQHPEQSSQLRQLLGGEQ